jgi:magnesium transporter
VVLAATGLVSGWILFHFQDTLSAVPALLIYIPMMAAAGGNVGSQSATIVIRAMALGEITPSETLWAILKELRVAGLLALLLGGLAFARVYLLSGGAEVPVGSTIVDVALVVALALAVQVATAALIGTVLPFAAAMLKLDPAVVASPVLTTLVDITGLLIYFTVASLILGA